VSLPARELIERLIASADVPPAWREAVEAVPRHAFVPECVWEQTDYGLVPVRRADDPTGWLQRVYADAPVITQADDGDTAPGENGRYVSSSTSTPSLVFRMLAELDADPRHRVLEIGTGTGWNAGLLAARLGPGRVFSVEIDPALAERARTSLAAVGLSPTVITGDGTDGYPPGAPYDRVVATASVRRVPYAWVAQTRPGGLIVTPWGTPYHNGALLKLVVRDEGTAAGRFVGQLAFMWLRGQRIPFGRLEERVRPGDDAAESVTVQHPYKPVNDMDASFAVGLRVPGVQSHVVPDDDGDPYHYVLWLTDPASGSWACLAHERGARTFPVRQHGRRRLWDEVEAAYGWWVGAGRPAYSRFGLTVSRTGQTVWLDDPETPTWAAPAPGV
jgi:protein-L-isoaspartate(D-aspartate) O-methyltransferase